MAEQLKEMFNESFYIKLAQELKKVDKDFKVEQFKKAVTKDLYALSLNQRLRNTSIVLKQFMPNDYKKTLHAFYDVIPHLKQGYTTLIFPDFVGLYGHEHYNLSLEALKYFTRFGTSEFAIREFLKNDFQRTIKVMEKWTQDDNIHVRRLASEGSRPRLPWSFKLNEVIHNPSKTRAILDALKADGELYVKKSVANHLNDISKDNPTFMLSLLKSWDKTNSHTLWISKHASRTLIKKGDKNTLKLFNFNNKIEVKTSCINIHNSNLKLGDSLKFDFTITSSAKKSQNLVIDYKLYYCKKDGKLVPKVFKLKEVVLKPGEILKINKNQEIKDFSTRKHYPGKHKIELLINGNKVGESEFNLKIKG